MKPSGIACLSNGTAILIFPNLKDLSMSEEILRRIEQKLDEVLKIVGSLPSGGAAATSGEYQQATCTDAELDDKYGNPEVRLVPSKWTGQDYLGWKYGDCSPEFLDEMSNMLDAIGRKQSKDPAKARNAKWSAKDAARARAWAARLRAKAAEAGDSVGISWGGDTDDLPF